MKNLLLSIICCLTVIASALSQVDFQRKTLEEVSSNKPIFVDVYTTWCGPCKKMDLTTFQDSAVSAILNENFTCLKWDAEDERFRYLAKRFDVSAYPTVLFLSADGVLIKRSIGYKDASELFKTTEELLRFMDGKPLKGINIPSLTLDESVELLTEISSLEVPEKSEVLDHLISLVGSDEGLWKAHMALISLCAYDDLALEHVEKLISHHKTIQTFDRSILRKQAQIQRRLTELLAYRLKKARRAADYPLYFKVSRLRSDLTMSSGAGRGQGFTDKQLKTDRLDYYRSNEVKDRYKPLADSLIADYILPYSPDEVAEADRSQTRHFTRLAKSFDFDEQDEKVDSTSLDFYKSQHRNGYKIADRLDNIANGILELYEDTIHVDKALEYSTLSYEYFQQPKYLVTKAKILFELGHADKAITMIERAAAHQFSDSAKQDIDELLQKYKGK